MMKRALIPLMFCVAGVATSQQKPAAPNRPPMTVTMLPGVKISEAVPAVGTTRIYYTTFERELFVYDRASKQSTLVGRGDMSEIALSPNNDRIAFGRGSEANARDLHIWTMPLDPATGAAAGPARRVSVSAGHAPSFSPDGQQIAFAAKDSAGKEHAAVMPASGGAERIVDKTARSIELIRWSPDGRTLYLGDWGVKGQPTAAYRVPLTGGAGSLVAKLGASYPGPSPDARLRATIDENWDSVVVAGSNGKPVGAFEFIDGADIASWNGNTKLFVPNGRPPYKLRAYSLLDGSTRALTDSTSDVGAPHWSPDGRRIAVTERGGKIEIMNADGSGRRAVAKGIPIPGCVWSPDGRWISFKKKGSLAAVEVATGREVTLARQLKMLEGMAWWSTVAARWAPDSRSLFYTEYLDTIAGAPLGSRFALHQVTLAGVDRVLREVATFRGFVDPPFLGDSSIEFRTRDGAQVIAPLRSGAPQTTLMPENKLGMSIPSFSTDGRRVAFRTSQGPSSLSSDLEIMRADGSQRTKINLPFLAAAGRHNPMFLPDQDQLLVVGQEKRNGDFNFYRVSLDGTISRKLLTIPYAQYGRNDWAYELSPDGKTLLYITDQPPFSTFTDVDLSAFLKLAPVKKTP